MCFSKYGILTLIYGAFFRFDHRILMPPNFVRIYAGIMKFCKCTYHPLPFDKLSFVSTFLLKIPDLKEILSNKYY